MIAALVAATPAERRLLRSGRQPGAMPWVIAIMTFIMVVIAAAGLAMAGAARSALQAVEHRYSLEATGLIDAQPRLAAAARGAPGVAAVHPVKEEELRSILERWLGSDAAKADLPLPALLDLDLARGADPAAVERYVRAAVPEARLVAFSSRLGPLVGALHALAWLALALVLLTALATAAAVVLATRGALDTHRSTIEVMHGIGATDDQVARLFQRKVAIDSLAGGTAGTVAAGIVLMLLAGGSSRWLGLLAGGPLLSPLDVLLLALLPLAGAVLATFVARQAVLRKLGESL